MLKSISLSLILSCHLLAVQASYTAKEMNSLASAYYVVVKNELDFRGNEDIFLLASEFRGYIASSLDFIPAFDACRSQYSLNELSYRSSALIMSREVKDDAISSISALVAIKMVCDSKIQKKD